MLRRMRGTTASKNARRTSMGARLAFLLVALFAVFTLAGAPLRAQGAPVRANTDLIALLLPDGQDAAAPEVTVWLDAAAEEGLHMKVVRASEFLAAGAATAQYAGVVIPDQVHKLAEDALVMALDAYVKAGGYLMPVYDAASTAPSPAGPVFPIAGSRFRDMLGVNFLSDAQLVAGAAFGFNSVFGTENTMYELRVPPGKFLPRDPSSPTLPTYSNNVGATPPNLRLYGLADTVGISGYVYGFLSYPYFATVGTFAGQTLLTSSNNDLIAGYNLWGNGGVLYVNIPLGYLKGYGTDGLLLHGFLHYFAVNVMKLPYLTGTPEGTGGLVLNWHIDPYKMANTDTGRTSIDDLDLLKLTGIFNEGPFSMHVTSGPHNVDIGTPTRPGDNMGWNLPNNPRLQAHMREWRDKGHALGSHGGWAHDYWGFNAAEGNEFDLTSNGVFTFQRLISQNHQDVQNVVGQPLREYSAAQGNNPKWAIRWLEDHGILAYYTVGNTGMAPTRSYRDTQRFDRTIWSVPLTPFGRWAVPDEFEEAAIPSDDVANWYRAMVEFSAMQHTGRMIYTHITGPFMYPQAFAALFERARLHKADDTFRWYTMTQLAQFMTQREQVAWTVSQLPNGLRRFDAAHPASLAGMTWSLRKSAYLRPVVIAGDAVVGDDGDEWLVTAQSGTTLQFESPAVSVGELNDIIVNNDPGLCGAVVTFPTPAFTSAHPPVLVEMTPPSGSTFAVGSTVVNVKGTDAAGNIITAAFTVTVNDTEKPILACPAAIAVDAPAGQAAAIVNVAPATATDNCPSPVQVAGVRSDGKALTDPFPAGATTITWTATDAAGNAATCAQTVTVRGGAIVVPPATWSVSTDPGKCSADLSDFSPTMDGGTPPYTLEGTRSDGQPLASPFPKGITLVDYVVTDGAGKVYTGKLTLEVKDAEKPIIQCPANISKAVASGQTSTTVTITQPTVTDNCPDATATGARSDGKSLTSTYPVGVTTITWTARDASGNTSACSQTVTITADQRLVLSAPAGKSVGTDTGKCSAVVSLGSATATGGSTPYTFTATRADGLALTAAYPKGATVVTWKVTDARKATATGTQTITVRDDEAPKLACPAATAATAANGASSASVTITKATATDNCDATVNVVGARNDGKPLTDPYPVGTTTITWTATDAAGNKSTCSQTVTVNGGAIMLPPGTFNTTTDPGKCSANFSDSSDFEGVPRSAITGARSDGQPLWSPFPKGSTVVNYTFKGSDGKTYAGKLTVNVADAEKPTITSASVNKTVLWPAERQMVDVTVSYKTADNCPGVTASLSVKSSDAEKTYEYGDLSPDWQIVNANTVRLRAERLKSNSKRTYTITITAKDASGNVTTKALTVTVPRTKP